MKKIMKMIEIKNKMIISLVLFLVCALAASAGYYTNPISSNPELIVTYMNQDPDPVEPGGYVELRFKIENNGTEKAEDVQIEIIPEYPFTIDSGEAAVRSIGIINGRQAGSDAVIVKYRMRVDKDAVSGDNTIDIKYSATKSGWIKKKDNIVNIRSHFAILSIENVESNPEVIKPGEVAKLTIRLTNMADALLKDIKINLFLYKATHGTAVVVYEEKPFTPIGSSNEKTIGNLERGKKAAISFDLIADPDAESGVYKIPLTISYTDNTGKNYSIGDNIIGLVIGDEPDLVTFIVSSELREETTIGEVSVKFVNKGTSDIKFLYSKLKESNDFDILSPKDVYVGNIDSDDYENADYKLHLKRTKGVVLPLQIEYRDANNQFYRKSINLPLDVISAKMAGEAGSGGSKLIGFFIVIVIVVGGIFFYKRWKKKRKKR